MRERFQVGRKGADHSQWMLEALEEGRRGLRRCRDGPRLAYAEAKGV
jgi:hypothetical protein